ncbi:MAG: hypothetical protein ACI4F7_04695 [Acutalibacteraceae bacterium]
MNNISQDHTKKYMMIDGHQIELSFATEPNTELFARISSILLDSNPHICNNEYSSLKSGKRKCDKNDG